jgi:hypothetical protein
MRKKTLTLPPIHLACSTDEIRPAMNCVWINSGIAYATDAHVLAVVDLREESGLTPDQIEFLHGKLIHRNVWKLLCKSFIQEITATGIVVLGDYATVEYRFAEPDMKYPNVITVLNERLAKPLESVPMYAFDPKLIKIAAEIIGTQYLHFTSHGNSGTFIRSTEGYQKIFVLAMPCMHNESNDPTQAYNFKFF